MADAKGEKPGMSKEAGKSGTKGGSGDFNHGVAPAAGAADVFKVNIVTGTSGEPTAVPTTPPPGIKVGGKDKSSNG